MIKLTHIAKVAALINLSALIMTAFGIVGMETLTPALYWPWVTYYIVFLTK